MINMRLFFQLTLLTSLTLFVESGAANAQDGIYERMRKVKNPSSVDLERIKTDSIMQTRGKAADQTSTTIKNDDAQMKQEALRDRTDDGADDKDDPVKDARRDPPDEETDKADGGTKTAVAGATPAPGASPNRKGLPALTTQDHTERSVRRMNPAPAAQTSSDSVKVNPGNLDELEFPGPAAGDQPARGPQKKKK